MDDKLEQLFSSCGWIGLFGLEIFVLCCSCSATKTEAKRIGSNLHHYAMDCNSVRCKRKVSYSAKFPAGFYGVGVTGTCTDFHFDYR